MRQETASRRNNQRSLLRLPSRPEHKKAPVFGMIFIFWFFDRLIPLATIINFSWDHAGSIQTALILTAIALTALNLTRKVWHNTSTCYFLGMSEDLTDLTEEEEEELRKIAEDALFKAFNRFKQKWPTMNKVFENFPQIYCEPMN